MDHLRHIFERSRDAIGVSLRGVHVVVNPAYAELFGASSPAALVGVPVLDLIGSSSHAAVGGLIDTRADGKPAPTVYETRGRRLDGTEFDMEVYVSSYEAAGGIHTLVTLRDVTERNRASRDLRESEEKFRTLTEQALMGVAIVQADRIAFVNARHAEMMEYTPEEMTGWSSVDYRKLIHPEDAAYVLGQLAKKLRGEPAVAQYIFRAVTKNGRVRWHELHSKPITWGGKPAVLMSQLDVTARHDAEEEKHLLTEALRQAQKMEAVGRLAGGIAHDFNNLLTIILGNVVAIGRALPPGGVAQEALDDTQAAAGRAAELTAQLLTFSRKQVVLLRPVALNEVIERTEGLMRRLVAEDATLITELAKGLPRIEADVVQLERVLVNLVINARDAVTSGGTIRIETASVTLDEKQARAVTAPEAGRYVRLSVEDDGCGMSEDVQRQIFEPFFTTKPLGKGTGLGLAMVYGAVVQHGGGISLRSTLGKGSRFDIWLPATDLVAEAVPTPPIASASPGGTELILLVEDEAPVRKLAQRLLVELGYQVLVAADGKAAIELAEKTDRPIDLLFTDVVMPGMTGRVVAERLAERLPSLRILFTSGYSGDVIGEDGLLAKGVEFIQKPYRPEELARRIRAALDRKL